MMEEAPVRFELVDINEILKTLPHRYPMLLIDRVKNIRTDYSGIGIKNVTFNEPPFLGHFPDRPVYPGVMMIEAMAQTAGVIGIKSVEGTEKPRAVYFLTIDKCKFRKPVMPGDTEPGPAVVTSVRRRSPDVPIEELAHRGRGHEAVECFERKFAKSIVAALDADDHGALRAVVADALDDGAAVDIPALKRAEIDQAAIAHVHRLRADRRGQ
jgi:3-hydroxyacyl-[acyl-carrier-protein] dehydratase